MNKKQSSKLIRRLEKNNQEYEENYVFLERYENDRVKQRPYVKIERKLQRECVQLQNDLDILLPDPCPLSKPLVCKNCTGRYLKINTGKLTKSGLIIYKTKPVHNGAECPVKTWVLRKDSFLKSDA